MKWFKRKRPGSPAQTVPQRQFVDLRSEAERQLERNSTQPLDEADERQAQLLVSLLERMSFHATQGIDHTQLSKQARQIGEELCSQGGSQRMKKVAYRAQALGINVRLIEMVWDGICGWEY
mgnify:CR=1 FL=1